MPNAEGQNTLKKKRHNDKRRKRGRCFLFDKQLQHTSLKVIIQL